MSAGVLIIGGGHAGLECAAALRTQGFDGAIKIVCQEPHPPYQRPPLSKEYLAGKQAADSLPLRAPSYYSNHAIELLLGEEAVSIDRADRRVKLASGTLLQYDKLVLAVGAQNRKLRLKGSEPVLYLRTRDESDEIKGRIQEAQRIAVIGGGFIGLEIAACARALGKEVTVIETMPRLMARAVAPVLSDYFLNLHRDRGTEVILSSTIQELDQETIALSDGRKVAADLVIAGIGVMPNTTLAEQAGLEVGNGVVVDELLRTEDPDLYAIGDCADHPNLFAGGRTRLESVQNAVDQAKCVARGIVGNPTPYRDVPWFWTDQFETRFQMVGLSAQHDQAVLRGGIENGKFSVFYFRERQLLAVDSVNRFADHVAARKILGAGTPVTPEQVADESFDLKKLSLTGVSRSEVRSF